jgi:hypothetical protein
VIEAKFLFFHSLQLECWIEENNDSRLGWLSTQNPYTSLLGKRLLGQPQLPVIEFVRSQLGDETEWEDHGSMESVFFEEQWLELQFEMGLLRRINFGVLYDENDNPAWPEH